MMKKVKAFAVLLILSMSMVLSPIAHANFTDIPANHQFNKEINHLVNLGAISGYQDGTYRASQQVTRGQAAKILAISLRMPLINPNQPTFKDVPKSNANYQYIETLAAKGIIGGYEDGTFRPGNSLSRAQMSKIIANSFDLTERSFVMFQDVDRNAWYYPHIDQLATSKITTGYPDNTFKPNAIVTRGQIAAFVSRGIHGYDRNQFSYRDVYLKMSKAQVRTVEGIPSFERKNGETDDYIVYDYVNDSPLNTKITYQFLYGKLNVMEFDLDVKHIKPAETEAFFQHIVNNTNTPLFGPTTSNEKYKWTHSDISKDSLYAFWFSENGSRIELILKTNYESGTTMVLRIS